MTFSLIIQLIRKISKECFQTCQERVHIATFQLTNKFTDIKTIVFIADRCVKRSYEIKKTIFLPHHWEIAKYKDGNAHHNPLSSDNRFDKSMGSDYFRLPYIQRKQTLSSPHHRLTSANRIRSALIIPPKMSVYRFETSNYQTG